MLLLLYLGKIVMRKIHFIAIGGAAMHNLAIDLKNKGFYVTGSDDEIFEPSRSRLEAHGLLPEKFGWFPEKITHSTDTVILGMHAKADNPELIKAKELGVSVVSYPEFLYNQTKDKLRIVVAGSHGKTTTTAMILHVLKTLNRKFDYMVGSQIEGFELMVGLSDNSEIAVFEGDEYLSSPIDLRSKFHWYKPDIAVITGIEWDHINVFPTFEEYVATFRSFAEAIPETGKLFWYKEDIELQRIAKSANIKADLKHYPGLDWEKRNDYTVIKFSGKEYKSHLFGNHNFQNMNAAMLVCSDLGIDSDSFLKAMEDFKGASRRLQKIKDSENPIFFDFAHAPSKVRATVLAVRQMFPDKKVVACYELHTFSSLNRKFIPHYSNTLDKADKAFVYFNSDVLKHKSMPEIDPAFVAECFKHHNLEVYTDNSLMFEQIFREWRSGAVVLLMSSGNFGGYDLQLAISN